MINSEPPFDGILSDKPTPVQEMPHNCPSNLGDYQLYSPKI